jgi:5-methylcytosine-specific restriction protein A
LRNKILKEQPFCIKCGSNSDLQVDHIIPPRGNEELFFNEDNLQTLCRLCHSVKTNNEIRNRK